MVEQLHPDDKFVMDGGYKRNFVTTLLKRRCVVPHEKPRGGELKPPQVRENSVITEFRGDIERLFGTVGVKYNFIQGMWRHGERVYNFEFRCACALYNLDLLGKADKNKLEQRKKKAKKNNNFFRIFPRTLFSRFNRFLEIISTGP